MHCRAARVPTDLPNLDSGAVSANQIRNFILALCFSLGPLESAWSHQTAIRRSPMATMRKRYVGGATKIEPKYLHIYMWWIRWTEKCSSDIRKYPFVNGESTVTGATTASMRFASTPRTRLYYKYSDVFPSTQVSVGKIHDPYAWARAPKSRFFCLNLDPYFSLTSYP